MVHTVIIISHLHQKVYETMDTYILHNTDFAYCDCPIICRVIITADTFFATIKAEGWNF